MQYTRILASGETGNRVKFQRMFQRQSETVFRSWIRHMSLQFSSRTTAITERKLEDAWERVRKIVPSFDAAKEPVEEHRRLAELRT